MNYLYSILYNLGQAIVVQTEGDILRVRSNAKKENAYTFEVDLSSLNHQTGYFLWRIADVLELSYGEPYCDTHDWINHFRKVDPRISLILDLYDNRYSNRSETFSIGTFESDDHEREGFGINLTRYEENWYLELYREYISAYEMQGLSLGDQISHINKEGLPVILPLHPVDSLEDLYIGIHKYLLSSNAIGSSDGLDSPIIWEILETARDQIHHLDFK